MCCADFEGQKQVRDPGKRRESPKLRATPEPDDRAEAWSGAEEQLKQIRTTGDVFERRAYHERSESRLYRGRR